MNLHYINPARTKKQTLPKAAKMPKEEDTPGLINGIQAMSSYEWNIARALWLYDWTFSYQVPIRSGRRIRGGQVLDFIVDTVPSETVIRVQGSYWHRNKTLESLKASEITEALGFEVRILDAYDQDASTFDQAKAFILQNIGRKL